VADLVHDDKDDQSVVARGSWKPGSREELYLLCVSSNIESIRTLARLLDRFGPQEGSKVVPEHRGHGCASVGE
jgi:hypothetical protein